MPGYIRRRIAMGQGYKEPNRRRHRTMKRILTASIISLLVSGLLASSGPALAGQSEFSQAAALYKAGNYKQALAGFQALEQKYPRNELVHYYMALSHQAMGHIGQAKSQYQWIIDNGKSNLKAKAQTGLAQLGAAKTHIGGNPSASASQAQSAPTQTQAAVSQGKAARIIDFYADWCGPCKKFGPVFEATSSQFRSIRFEKKNIDHDENKDMVQRFGIQAIPRMVILDKNDKVLYNESPPRDEESLAAVIKKFQ